MTRTEYKSKSKLLENLLKLITEKGRLSKKHQLELDELSDLIATNEEEHFAFEPSNLIEMIELRMYQRKLKQKEVAEILGTTPSRISEILNGKRGLTIDLAEGLYTKLNIDPALILTA
jgi:HTH-type transcriptional regulator/antitoxin HigA